MMVAVIMIGLTNPASLAVVLKPGRSTLGSFPEAESKTSCPVLLGLMGLLNW